MTRDIILITKFLLSLGIFLISGGTCLAKMPTGLSSMLLSTAFPKLAIMPEGFKEL